MGRSRSPYTYEETDSDAIPLGERFSLWRDTGRLPMEPEPSNEEERRNFHIRLRSVSGPAGRFSDLFATPMRLNRAADRCHKDGIDLISLTLILGRPIEHQFGASLPEVVVAPGRILSKDLARPAAAQWSQRPHRGLNLHLPRGIVSSALGPKVERLHGAVLSGERLVPMLRVQLRLLSELLRTLDEEARAAALDVAVTLATVALRLEYGSRVEDEEHAPGLFAAARIVIERHLDSRLLRPEMIARQIGCSRAHLYRVFAANGATVADYIREARLCQARTLLKAADYAGERIGDIAFRCGFDDPVHFARLFRERFGMTPREVRASVREGAPVATEGRGRTKPGVDCLVR